MALGFSPHVFPYVERHMANTLRAFGVDFFTCVFHESSLSRVIPRYLASVFHLICVSYSVRVFNLDRSLFLVNDTTVVLPGLMDRWLLLHHPSTIFKAPCVSSDAVLRKR